MSSRPKCVNIERTGKVIKILRNRTVSFTKLREETGIDDKPLSTILKVLEGWSLVKKGKGRLAEWRWYESITEFESTSQLELAMKHTQDLVPALRTLLDRDRFELLWMYPYPITDYDRYVTSSEDEHGHVHEFSFVESHLRTGYPKYYDQLVELRKLNDSKEKMKESFMSVIWKKIENALREREADESKWDYMSINRCVDDMLNGLLENIYVYDLIKFEIDFSLDGDELKFKDSSHTENAVVIKSEHYSDYIDEFRKLREKEENLRGDFAGNIGFLLMSIGPLKGNCKLCPKVIVLDDKTRNKPK